MLWKTDNAMFGFHPFLSVPLDSASRLEESCLRACQHEVDIELLLVTLGSHKHLEDIAIGVPAK